MSEAKKRAVLLCPGRGSYTESCLGSLPEAHPFVEAAEELRAEYGRPPLLDLDRRGKFESVLHLKPSNVSPLIYVISMLDAETAKAAHRIVAVGGNSLGWYTSLAVGGALSFEDGFRLVQEIALLQEQHGEGGQILYPLVDDEWRIDSKKVESVAAALEGTVGHAFESIRLGGVIVLAATISGLRELEARLPKVKVGKNAYPFRLMQHGPYHTPLLGEVATQARERLASLDWRRPEILLIDGAGRRYAPWAPCAEALAEYTLTEQIVTPFDFSSSVRVALRETAPDRIVLPGPGNTLGGVVGQCLVQEGWRGIRDKAGFEAIQGSPDPIVVSMRR